MNTRHIPGFRGTAKLIRMLIVVVIAIIVTGGIIGCGQAPSAITITGTPTINSNRIITVNYTVKNIASTDFARAPLEGLHVICTASNGTTSFSSQESVTIQNSGDTGVVTIQINSTVQGNYQVTCKLGSIATSDNSFTVIVPAPVTSSLPTCSTTGYSPQSIGFKAIFANADCTPTSTPVGSGPYYIYSLNLSGPNIFVGSEADIQTPSCSFSDGGDQCTSSSANVTVLATLGGPYDTLAEATTAYCGMVTGVYASALGGTKGYINGVSYWLDNAPTC